MTFFGLKKQSNTGAQTQIYSNTYLMFLSFFILCFLSGYYLFTLFLEQFYPIPIDLWTPLSHPDTAFILFSILASGFLFGVSLKRHTTPYSKSTFLSFCFWGVVIAGIGAYQAFSARVSQYNGPVLSVNLYFDHSQVFNALFQMDKQTSHVPTFKPQSDVCQIANQLNDSWAKNDPRDVLMTLLDRKFLIQSYSYGCTSSTTLFHQLAQNKIKALKTPMVFPGQAYFNQFYLKHFDMKTIDWCMYTREWREPQYVKMNPVNTCSQLDPQIAQRILTQPIQLEQLGIIPRPDFLKASH